MASVWNPGTRVKILAGTFAGWGATVTSTDAGEIAPITVEIHGADTSRRSYLPDDLAVIPEPRKREFLIRR